MTLQLARLNEAPTWQYDRYKLAADLEIVVRDWP